jgi:glycosyltransferase involved in cell wall biosynthesis
MHTARPILSSIHKGGRIAHILPWTTVGGVESATLRIVESVDDEFKHYAFNVHGAKPVRHLFEANGIETVEYFPVEHSYRHFRPFLAGSRALATQFRQNEISLVHCSDLLAGFHAALAGRLARIPVLCHVRGIFSGLSRRDQSFLYAVNHFAFVSNDTWAKFGFSVSRRRGTIVYDGIDVSSRYPSEPHGSILESLGIPSTATIVGMIARVAEAKDYFTLGRAAVKVIALEPNVRFLIVGDNAGTEPYRRHYEQVMNFLTELGIVRNFIFTGHQTNVLDYLSLMDVFVLSTHSEGLPLVILEAMAQGRPVIATRIGGIPEIIDDGNTGFLYEHEDHEAFATLMLTLLRNRELRDKIGNNGREEVALNWTVKRFGNDMKSLYQKLINGNASFDSTPSFTF